MNEYSFKVLFLPPSHNSMYSYNHRTKSMFMTETARHFKTAIKIACPPMKFSCAKPILDLCVEYHSPKWVCKNGNIRKQDGFNMDKILYDAVSERIGIDDSLIFYWAGSKVLDKEEYTLIKVKEQEALGESL